MTAKISISLLFLFLLSACSSINDGLTADPRVVENDFDGSVEIHQPSVSSASGLSEDWSTIGLYWLENSPDFIIVEAGVNGIQNIKSIAFNIDGEILNVTNARIAFTEFEHGYGYTSGWSYRSFTISLDEFDRIANADTVKFKVNRLNGTYDVSTFGKQHPNAVLSAKLPKFSELLQQNL